MMVQWQEVSKGRKNGGKGSFTNISTQANKVVADTLGARLHNLIEILKYYCKEIRALFTIILTKLFERFLKYFYSIFLQNIQKL
jgi:hypothetical protein